MVYIYMGYWRRCSFVRGVLQVLRGMSRFGSRVGISHYISHRLGLGSGDRGGVCIGARMLWLCAKDLKNTSA